jgi:hypothetical protein
MRHRRNDGRRAGCLAGPWGRAAALLALAAHLLVGGGPGCKGSVAFPKLDRGPPGDGRISPGDLGDREGSPTGDVGPRRDLPVNAGDPCVYHKCGPELICMVDTCRKMCDWTSCNDKQPECSDDEACLEASSFTGACLSAPHAYLEECSPNDWPNCAGGHFCVIAAPHPYRCLRVCETSEDCPGGVECTPLTTGPDCKVCDE